MYLSNMRMNHQFIAGLLLGMSIPVLLFSVWNNFDGTWGVGILVFAGLLLTATAILSINSD